MRKNKNSAQNMIVIVVPNIFIGKRDLRRPRFNINYFEAFLFEISDREVFAVDAERLTISADCAFYGHVQIRRNITNGVGIDSENLDLL